MFVGGVDKRRETSQNPEMADKANPGISPSYSIDRTPDMIFKAVFAFT
jgi:hypothetical protein